MSHEATHLMGVGATKAGTSWLHDYLVSHPEVANPPRKELHYFDSLSGEVPPFSLAKMRRTVTKEIAALEKRKETVGPHKLRPIERRIERLQKLLDIYADDTREGAAYSDYLNSEIECSGAKVTTDITPSYGLLSGEWIKRLASIMPVTRFVYILRDPVDRLWSNIRMDAGNRAPRGVGLSEYCFGMVDAIVASDGHEMLPRSNYASTLEKLENHVPEQSRWTMFFENMFSQNTMDAFCAFLGISKHPAKVDKPSYTGVSLKLDDARRTALSRVLAPQYAAVQARFGALPDRWQQNMTKV
ncbi:sulfotransferase [Falsihalocynthiibacter sp. SS001]|uniref:sulfotransferase n=1 Tax=Falsihalocynthiibacter sp. SS001 TaxID=3349698 RepID=UPI0036D421BA